MIVAVVMETRAARWRKCEKDVEVASGNNDGGSYDAREESWKNQFYS